MGKTKEQSRHYVISLRISDEELLLIKTLREVSKQSTSEFLRDALAVFMSSAQHGREDGSTKQCKFNDRGEVHAGTDF